MVARFIFEVAPLHPSPSSAPLRCLAHHQATPEDYHVTHRSRPGRGEAGVDQPQQQSRAFVVANFQPTCQKTNTLKTASTYEPAALHFSQHRQIHTHTHLHTERINPPSHHPKALRPVFITKDGSRAAIASPACCGGEKRVVAKSLSVGV